MEDLQVRLLTLALKTGVSEKKDSYLVLIFESSYDGVFLVLKYYKFSNVLSNSNLHSITEINHTIEYNLDCTFNGVIL